MNAKEYRLQRDEALARVRELEALLRIPPVVKTITEVSSVPESERK